MCLDVSIRGYHCRKCPRRILLYLHSFGPHCVYLFQMCNDGLILIWQFWQCCFVLNPIDIFEPIDLQNPYWPLKNRQSTSGPLLPLKTTLVKAKHFRFYKTLWMSRICVDPSNADIIQWDPFEYIVRTQDLLELRTWLIYIMSQLGK